MCVCAPQSHIIAFETVQSFFSRLNPVRKTDVLKKKRSLRKIKSFEFDECLPLAGKLYFVMEMAVFSGITKKKLNHKCHCQLTVSEYEYQPLIVIQVT